MSLYGSTHLQDLAAFGVTVTVLTRVKHAQSHTVQQDHEHTGPFKPRMEEQLRNITPSSETTHTKCTSLHFRSPMSDSKTTEVFFFLSLTKALAYY